VIEKESDNMKIRQELDVLNEDIKELCKALNNNKLIKKTETDFKKLHMTIYNIFKSDIVENTEEHPHIKTKNFSIAKYKKQHRNEIFVTEGDKDMEIAEEEPVGYKLNQLELCTNSTRLRTINSDEIRNYTKLNALKLNATYLK